MDNRIIIQNSIDYIENNLKTEITAAELADTAGFSIFHYYRLFQSVIGVPVMQYIVYRKLIHAIYEIACGGKMTDVALTYGFDTYAGFYRAFKREFGCTPSAFLQKHHPKKPYKINLFQEEHIMLTHKKITEILTYWNLEHETISDIYYEGNGNKNENAYYVGNEYVIKFTTNIGKLKNHMELSKSIERIGLCSATPIKTVNDEEYIRDGELYFYVTRRILGHQMSSEDIYEGDYPEKSRFVGEIIGQLHLALKDIDAVVNEANLYESVTNWAIPIAQKILNLSDKECNDYIHTFGDIYDKLPKQIIHRDPNPGNIICNKNSWGFIDFELSECNLRIFDPCYAATAVLSESFTNSDASKLDKWLQIYHNIIHGYDSVVGLTNEERVAIPYVLLANQFTCIAWFSTMDKYKDIFESNVNMAKWLMQVWEKLKIQ